MKIKMYKNGEVKGGGGNCKDDKENKIRITVFGQHDVGKSALTVRYLTGRYIGEYKQDTVLYNQPLAPASGNHNHPHRTSGPSLDIEIVDICTISEGSTTPSAECKTFPVDEIHASDGFIIVYSIIDKSSFATALEALADIHSHKKTTPTTPPPPPTNATTTTVTTTTPPQIKLIPIALIANKCDLEHLRTVDKASGIEAAAKYGCQFYELSVADNSPEVYQSFKSIISNLIATTYVPPPKRKFSVSRILRLGRNSNANVFIPSARPSMVDVATLERLGSTTSSSNESSCPASFSNSPAKSREGSPAAGGGVGGVMGVKRGKNERQGSTDSISSGLSHLKSKLTELHSLRKRHNSPPVCSL